MKAVMMSIQPEWCKIIGSGNKTIEVRKSKPKFKGPFKVYIYCTWGRKRQLHISNSYSTTKSPYEQFWVGKPINDISKGMHLGNGKVIGEFVCDFITNLSIKYSNPDCKAAHNIFPYTGLTDKQIIDYLGNGKDGYGWHISDLVIYDKPKQLSEFHILDKEKQKACAHRERYYTNPDWTNSAELPAGFTCDIGTEIDFCRPFENKGCICLKPISRPPQSWCYVAD